jgi:hypothetical protein
MSVFEKLQTTARWLPFYCWQSLVRRRAAIRPLHLIIGLADHFEPAINPQNPRLYASRDRQLQRLEFWTKKYPDLAGNMRDADGFPFRHTYFYPAEQYDQEIVAMIAEHCHQGWGELEIHLHHGVDTPDTAQNTRKQIEGFRDRLVEHGCLSRLNGAGPPRFAFVHGNWTLANSGKGHCGVDEEMQILAETGCYADFTLPSAPNPAQTAKINSIYECALPLHQRAPHRRGHDLKSGAKPQVYPLIIQGPLALVRREKANGRRRWTIENGEVCGSNPPTMERLESWIRVAIGVRGRPDWIFIKLHCHGMDPRDQDALLGAPMTKFLRDLNDKCKTGDVRTHFVTAREMANMALAACGGCAGNPGKYRDYLLKRIVPT